MFLLDTNIISASAPTELSAEKKAFAAWLHENQHNLYLSAITIAEIEAGIARAIRVEATTKAQKLRQWLSAIEHLYGNRILPFGTAEAKLAGQIIDRARAHDPGFEDIAIAATAAAHSLIILTINERHFGPLGVPFNNPLKGLPEKLGR